MSSCRATNAKAYGAAERADAMAHTASGGRKTHASCIAAQDALLAAIDRALGRTAAPQAERVPCAGWVLRANGRWYLAAGDYEARAVPADATGDSRNLDAGPARWDVSIPEFGRRRILRTDEGEPDDLAPSPLTPPATLRLAQLAAEDAIAELCTAGLRAIGR